MDQLGNGFRMSAQVVSLLTLNIAVEMKLCLWLGAQGIETPALR